VGWLYYLSELIFKIQLWVLGSIFLLTAIRLGSVLEVEKKRLESKNQLVSSQMLTLDQNEIALRNQETCDALIQAQKRGHCLYTSSKIACIVVGILINGILAIQYTLKREELVSNGLLQAGETIKIDSLLFFFILVYISTLASALVIFKVLEKRHKMKIKRLQAFIAALLGIGVLILNLLQYFSGFLILRLMNKQE